MEQQVNEQQLVQMIKQEEANLASREDYFMKLRNVLGETVKSIDSLKEIQKKPGKIIVRLGAGILVDAEIKNTDTCKRTFSESGFQETKISDTVKWLEEKRGNLERQLGKIQADLVASKNNIDQLISAIKQIEAEKQKNISVK
jgi:prefoldin subunit 5